MKYNNDIKILHRFFVTVYIVFTAIEFLCIISGTHAAFNLALFFLNSSIFIPLIIRSYNTRTFALDPFYIYGIWYALCYFISTTPIYTSKDVRGFFTVVNLDPLNQHNITSIIFLGFGILCFYLGYSLMKSPQRKSNANHELPTKITSFIKKYHRIIWIVYFYSVLFRLYGYSIGAMGSLSAALDSQWPPIPFISVFVFLANIWPVYLAAVMLVAFENKSKRIIILLLIIELVFVIVSGDRRNIIFLMFIFLYCYRVINHSLPWPIIKLAVPAVLLALPLLTIIGYTMTYMDKIDLSTIPTILSVSYDRLSSIPISEVLTDFIYSPIIDSFGYIPNVFVANTEFALKGESWGSVGIENVMSKLVPGFIGGGGFDERAYYQLFADKYLTYHVDYSHLTFTFQSEMVLSYGLFAIPLGMLVQGVFAKYLFELSRKNNCSPLYFIFYCGFGYKFSLGLVSGMLTPDYIVGVRALLYLCIILIFVKLFSKRKRQLSLMTK